jgi:P-type Ca2+ transporter type 2C
VNQSRSTSSAVSDPEHGVDTSPDGLTAAAAAQRLDEHGPNELASTPPTPLWRRVVTALSDRMVLVLLVAAAVALVVNREAKTPVVIVVVVALNTALGLVQEGRASRALDSLRAMTAARAQVRRDGRVMDVPAREVVPGDIVLLDAGDRVPADGRLRSSHTFEIDESALTGESRPVEKSEHAEVAPDAPVGDRLDRVFMHTSVTRGRGEYEVTATGMGTEIGRIAGLLGGGEIPSTPLQRQLHRLAGRLALLAGVVVAAVMALGLVRGRPFGEVFESAVALAVASIPEGLPAVTAVTLALGVQRMARRNAIVKRLAAVETLGCTTVICTDKTGTLTLNRMTAQTVVHSGHAYDVSDDGEGDGDGAVTVLPAHLAHLADAAVLCNDATVHGDQRVGDPTELALLTLVGDRDPDAIRRGAPRVAEMPFESSTKLMATLHDVSAGDAGRADGATADRLLVVKGAFDVLIERCSRIDVSAADGPDADDEIGPRLAELHDHHDRLAADGIRVLALASRHLDGDPTGPLGDEIHDLTLLGLVGIVDPARPEARDAIAAAHGAGMSVRMITGDHATTAAAIGRSLGLHGDVITGTELDALDERALGERLDHVAIYARVSPEHKLRLVEAFRARGDVVAMTGDGVNDAPALERADIGVAMGITGTDVTQQAAAMVLADDDFSTIVHAVEEGRSIYDGIVHFVRFQLSTSLGFALLFLLTAAFGVGVGAPFTAVAILWVNLIMDGPPAMALGTDPPDDDVMERAPRPPDEQILTRPRWITVGIAAVVMALGTLAVLVLAPDTVGTDGATTATAMAFTTFVLFQMFNLMNSRSDRTSVFNRRTLRNRWLWIAVAVVMALHVAVMHVGPAQRFVGVTSITPAEWAICAAVASSVLWVEEVRKWVVRRHPGTPVGPIPASVS